jgi:hypothetical protein
VTTRTSRILDDATIDVRFKISALWIAMLFLFAYGDIFGFLRADVIEEVIGGEVGGIAVTQTFLVEVSVYIAIASVMVFLSLVLKPTANRRVNIGLPILYVVSIVISCIGETWAYYLLLSAAECALLVLVIWYAWTWPRAEEQPT